MANVVPLSGPHGQHIGGDIPKKVTVIGGHGKMVQAAISLLISDGCGVTPVIRNPDQVPDIEALGTTPVVYDVTNLSTEQLTDFLSGYGAVIWSTGADGGSLEWTYVVDRDAATTSIAATEQASIKYYVMVSYSGASHGHGALEDYSFFVYAEPKAAADEVLHASNLEWTILGSSVLTLDKDQDFTDITMGKIGGAIRVTVVNIIAQTVLSETTVGHIINFSEGNISIAEALKG